MNTNRMIRQIVFQIRTIRNFSTTSWSLNSFPHATARQKYWDLILIPKSSSNPVFKTHPDLDEINSVTSSTNENATSAIPHLNSNTTTSDSKLKDAPHLFTSDSSHAQKKELDSTLLSKIKSLSDLNLQESILKSPAPPENCCMSGCVHCVWDIYQEEFSEYLKKKRTLRHLRKMLTGDHTQDSGKLNDVEPEEEPIQMDPSVKAFLDMEKSLKKSQQ